MVEMPDRIAAGLTAELDAVLLVRPRAAQARYHLPPRAAGIGGLAMAGATAAVLVIAVSGFATVATGSANPQVWTGQLAAGMQRLQAPVPARSSPPGREQPAIPGAAATAANGGEGGKPEIRRPAPGPGGQPSADPADSPRPRPDPSAGHNEHRSSPSPSPRPSGQTELPTSSR